MKKLNELMLTLLACFACTAGARAAMDVTEEQVVVKTPDGSAEAALLYPATEGKYPEVLLWPDIVGLRPLYRDIARRLASEGFVVLVPNAFYRSMRPSDEELDAWDPQVRPRLMTYRGEATDDGIARDAVAYLAFLDAHPRSNVSKKVATVGYDLGGSYAFRTAAARPDRVGAVASIYGLGVATARPNSPHLLVLKTKASYYVAISKDDAAREPEDVVDIRKVIADAGLIGTVEVRDANHDWANPARKAHDADEAEYTVQAVLAMLKASLD